MLRPILVGFDQWHARAHVSQTAMHLWAHINFDAHFLDFGMKYDRVVFSSDGSFGQF